MTHLNSTPSTLSAQKVAAPVSTNPSPVTHQPSTLSSLAPEESRTFCQRIKDFFSYLWSLVTRCFQRHPSPSAAPVVESAEELEYNFYLTPYKTLISQYKDAGKMVCGTLNLVTNISPGKVLMDKTHAFGTTIKLLNGNFINVSQEDLLCPAVIKNGEQTEERMLPSSLFTQGLIKNRVYFIDTKQDVLYQLDLKKFPFDKTFEQGVKSIEKSLHYKWVHHEYGEDVPPTYHHWGHGDLDHMYLSPNAHRIEIGKKGVSPLDFSTVEDLNSNFTQPIIFFKGHVEGNSVYKLAAPGNPKIDIILDGHILYAYIQPLVKPLAEKDKVLIDTRIPTLLREFCADKGEEVVKEEITATLDDTGILTIEIPVKASK